MMKRSWSKFAIVPILLIVLLVFCSPAMAASSIIWPGTATPAQVSSGYTFSAGTYNNATGTNSGGGSAQIKTIQYGNIGFSWTSSGTYTLPTAVTPANAIIIPLGWSGWSTDECILPLLTLTNSTTVTATTDSASANHFICTFMVLEFTSSAVKTAVQSGTITLNSSQASNTGTLTTSVGSKVLLVGTGYNTTSDTSAEVNSATVALSGGNTITATRGAASGTLTVGYSIIELN